MKEKLSNKFAFIGAGIGLTLFAVFGLMPGAFIGGVFGVNLATALFGAPMDPTIAARMIVAVGMLLGVMVSGLIFTVGGASAGWIAGFMADTATARYGRIAEARAHKH